MRAQSPAHANEGLGAGVLGSREGGSEDMPTSDGGVLRVAETGSIESCSNMFTLEESQYIFDLYHVGVDDTEKQREVPFVQQVRLGGMENREVQVLCVVDDGAMVNAIDETVFRDMGGWLGPTKASKKVLRMADGRLSPSVGVWEGLVKIGGAEECGAFEVFDSHGAWSMLFGKPLLKAFDAVHVYNPDTLVVPVGDSQVALPNLYFETASPFAPSTLVDESVSSSIAPAAPVVEGDGLAVPSIAGPVTSDGLGRRSREEREAWRTSVGLPAKKEQGRKEDEEMVKAKKDEESIGTGAGRG